VYTVYTETLLVGVDDVIEYGCCLLQCMSPLLALNGQISFAGFCPLSDNSGQRGSLAPSGLVAF